MELNRPDPNDLLSRIRTEEEGKKRGKLKIFFGYAAGVGKTYAMLEAARAAQKAGIDVLIGYVEPHTRPETLALLEGLPALPPLELRYKNITLTEFDLDAALERRPQLILVDELAHSNAGECRHPKRYSDIEELLRAGIDVYTTVNVQHLESLNDIVASITHVTVSERIPDHLFDEAAQVELVDIEPDDLMERLGQGKIYQKSQAAQAMRHFFTRENLAALREIALRRTADRVNRIGEKMKQPSSGGEHILVCLSASPSNAKVIRAAARMAGAFHGEFTALFVETPGTADFQEDHASRLRENLKLAQQLGAKIATVYGEDVPYQISQYAQASGISKIVMGRSGARRSLLQPQAGFVDRLTQLAPNMDVYIIPDAPRASRASRRTVRWNREPFHFSDILKLVGVLAVCTLTGLWFDRLGFSDANIILVYILGILGISTLTNRRAYGVVSSVVVVLAFNFFFTTPRFTFHAYGAEYPVTFAIMLVASLITSSLTLRVRSQAGAAARKAHRTEVLLETSQKLQQAKNSVEILSEAAAQIHKLLDKPVLVYPVENGTLLSPQAYGTPLTPEEERAYTSAQEQAVAAWVLQNNHAAGVSTETLPGAGGFYLAVRSHQTVFAVVGIPMKPKEVLPPFEKSLLYAMLNEIAFAMEKHSLNRAHVKITMEAEQERLRANLLRTISHDLRTPLTSISGNANILLASGRDMEELQRRQMYEDIYDDAIWLINLVENLLAVTRLDNGMMQLSAQPELLSEVIDEALLHINRKRTEHTVSVHLKDDLLMARMDSRLMIQVMINLVDNAIKYTPPGSCIEICTFPRGENAVVEVADDGPGIPGGDQANIFDMFYTVGNAGGDGRRSLGLGLSLCKSIVTAHGGSIYVRDNEPRGTVFGFTLIAEEVPVYENDYTGN